MTVPTRLLVVIATACAAFAVVPAEASAWHPCPENAHVQCTSVPVPVDWSTPDGARLTIAVARRAAPDPSRRKGLLIYLPAGPGSSGVDAVTDDQLFQLIFPPEVTTQFDVVSFDPRGVRRSTPVRCDAALVATLDQPAPTSQREFEALLAAQAAVGADCRERTGPVFDHLDSTQSAHDVDAIRALLGQDKVNLYGLSYGTVLGARYAELFGSRLRTLTLDGAYDHSASADRVDVTSALAAQESFDQFVAWCAADESCELHGKDLRRIVADLFTRAEQGTLTDSSRRELDPQALTGVLVSPLTRPDLPAVAHQIATLEASPKTAATTGEIPLPIYTVCADTRVDITTYAHMRALTAAERRVAPDVRGAASGVPTLCINPPNPPANPQHRIDAPDAPAVLVLNSRYDAATPYQGARRVADQFPRATFVTYDGLGHGAATRSTCTRKTFADYLTDRTLPAHDLVCPL